MPWLSIASGLVKLLSVVMGFLDRKQLINAGEAKAMNAYASETLKVIQRAAKRYEKFKNMSDSDLDDRV